MIRAAICDDDTRELDNISEIVMSYIDLRQMSVDIHTYSDSWKLALDIKSDGFDLYLLDVVMPKPDGLELGRLIRETDKTAVIIYLTSHEGRALDAYRVRAAQYLTKPVSRKTLMLELDNALASIQEKKDKNLMVKTKTRVKAIPFHKIVYCELENRCLCCTTTDGKKYSSLTLRQSFNDEVAPLLEDKRFFQPHTSYVVNMDFVNEIESGKILMKTGASVPVARSMKIEAKKVYLNHLFEE